MKHTKDWIQKAIKRPGAFTKKAKKHGESVNQYASQVLKKGSKAGTRTKRQAALAKTLSKMRQKKKNKKPVSRSLGNKYSLKPGEKKLVKGPGNLIRYG